MLVWLDVDVEIILGEVVMAAHQHKSVVCVSTTRELGKVVVRDVGLALCGREHSVVVLNFTSVALLFEPLLRGLLLDQQMPGSDDVRGLVLVLKVLFGDLNDAFGFVVVYVS